MFRTIAPRQLAFDLTLAACCFVLRLVIGMESVLLFAVLVSMAAALALRRKSPALALGIAWVGAIAQMIGGIDPDSCNLAILPVLYATASYGAPLVKWAGLASSGVGAIVVALYSSLRNAIYTPGCTIVSDCATGQLPSWAFSLLVLFVLSLTVFALSWTLGLLAKTWRANRESSQARVLAERRRIDAQRDTVIEQERNRIARDMHDVVAHSLAVVIAQADGARYARAKDPDAVDAALETIASTAREALTDVRILLAQLRHRQGEAPQPVLADLERLFEQLRSSGLGVESEVHGEPIVLATGQQLAIYRIVQEALTNALRHGDRASAAVVRFDWNAESVTVTVSNGADASSNSVGADAGGHGLAGMRERTVLWGGTFAAGEREGNRYVVEATLPISVRAGVDS
ncbi:MAG TPA: histidine kinase [Lacisediminihabitans sp.]|jgi:signal transduction histidine kinase|nr:histidine kinase [Lacisediminihabitans sp.]HXD60871.1 histidine kinase [Lacisediminihabitans sp.]